MNANIDTLMHACRLRNNFTFTTENVLLLLVSFDQFCKVFTRKLTRNKKGQTLLCRHDCVMKSKGVYKKVYSIT